jgi:hypothetical protein
LAVRALKKKKKKKKMKRHFLVAHLIDDLSEELERVLLLANVDGLEWILYNKFRPEFTEKN